MIAVSSRKAQRALRGETHIPARGGFAQKTRIGSITCWLVGWLANVVTQETSTSCGQQKREAIMLPLMLAFLHRVDVYSGIGQRQPALPSRVGHLSLIPAHRHSVVRNPSTQHRRRPGERECRVEPSDVREEPG